jgi:hypothetical protein
MMKSNFTIDFTKKKITYNKLENFKSASPAKMSNKELKDITSLKSYICLLVSILLFSCTKQERTRLNQRELAAVDSLYSQQLPSLRIQSDSICKSIRDSIFLVAVDSLLEIRLSEIELLVEER